MDQAMPSNDVMSLLRYEQPVLRQRFGVARLGVFGSVASGRASIESDVDIVVEFDRPIGLEFVNLAEHLERILGRNVDLITPEGVASIRAPGVANSIMRSVVYV